MAGTTIEPTTDELHEMAVEELAETIYEIEARFYEHVSWKDLLDRDPGNPLAWSCRQKARHLLLHYDLVRKRP